MDETMLIVTMATVSEAQCHIRKAFTTKTAHVHEQNRRIFEGKAQIVPVSE